jgi:predicted dehydrogenase
VADRYGFEFCTGNEGDILDDQAINTLFVATRHDSHASYVEKGLARGKHVFVEKPLCLTEVELERIRAAYSDACAKGAAPLLMVGYNRRFSPLGNAMKVALGPGPMAMVYRINAGVIPADSWIQDPAVGGGRIIGEACHFIDFLTFLNGSRPVSVYAASMRSALNLNDIMTISLTYENGSVGSVSYFSNGDKSLPKERVEVYCNGATAILDDFRSLSLHARGKRKEKKLTSQDKGQKAEVAAFILSVFQGGTPPISFDEIYTTSLATFKALESARLGQSVPV